MRHCKGFFLLLVVLGFAFSISQAWAQVDHIVIAAGTDEDHALQAITSGTANTTQQQRAYEYVVRTLCETDRMTFWPGGEDGRRATDFAEGKRWVGVQLRRIEKMRPDHRNQSSESVARSD